MDAHHVAMQHHPGSPDQGDSRPGRRLSALALIKRLAGALVLVGMGAVAQTQEAPQRLPVTRLTAGMHLITAEVAGSPEERAIGLMHRPSMPANHGMLFVFEQPGVHCFWMKNTLLPLSIAFLADDGSIVNIADMPPRSEASHCPTKPVRLALEMNQGWFAKRGLKAGSRIGGEAFAPR
jgi:uncharacterized membrane protein (UPF0127 family)